MKLLLDTHVWLWTLLEPEKISPAVAKKLQLEANGLWLSPISVWEAAMLFEKKRLAIQGDSKAWIRQALVQTGAKEASLNHEIALESQFLKLPHADPADRFLVATAKVMGLKLVTADHLLIKAKACEILEA